MTPVETIVGALLLAGCTFMLLATVGLWRFDDVFSRIHAATKASTLGVLLIVIAAMFEMRTTGDFLRLVLVALLQLVSAPVSGHMVGRAAYWANTMTRPHVIVDHLENAGRSR